MIASSSSTPKRIGLRRLSPSKAAPWALVSRRMVRCGFTEMATPRSQGVVTVIDGKKDEVSKVIQTEGKGAGRMAVSPDGKWAASTHATSEDVAVIDAMKKEVVANVRIGKGPGFPVFSPDSTKLFSMNYYEDNVTVIDLAQLKVVATYPVGKGPFGGGIRFRSEGRPTYRSESSGRVGRPSRRLVACR